jgi:hypothetical protein
MRGAGCACGLRPLNGEAAIGSDERCRDQELGVSSWRRPQQARRACTNQPRTRRPAISTTPMAPATNEATGRIVSGPMYARSMLVALFWVLCAAGFTARRNYVDCSTRVCGTRPRGETSGVQPPVARLLVAGARYAKGLGRRAPGLYSAPASYHNVGHCQHVAFGHP